MEKETSEIVKLTERISKDPKSKLFVPLAEEYKKVGDLEMAIHVLSEGLKNNPTYVTARSVLGKLLFEKGELKAAQKEFEEVVKAIPDNLMAQRKLADLHVLQNQPDEAVKHYKIVLSLTPKNDEVSSLISDIEAGQDVLAKLGYPKSLSSNRKPEKKEAQASVSSQPLPKESPIPVNMPEIPVITEQPVEPAPVPAEIAEESTGKEMPAFEPEPIILPEKEVPEAVVPAEMTKSPAAEGEEPEDVLTLEPLEEGGAEPGVTLPAYDFLAEQEQEMKSGPAETTSAEDFLTTGGSSQAISELTDIPAEPVIQEKATDEPGSAFESIPFEADIFEKEIVQEAPQAETPMEEIGMMSTPRPDTAPAEAGEDVSRKSDDFTTDTLAELYIGQGFYEKAIDIYQRMLADYPNSQALKDKLERVRSMAVEAAGQTAPIDEIKELNSPEEDIFSSSSIVEPSVMTEAPIDAEVLSEPVENRQDKSWEKEGTGAESFAEVLEDSSIAGPQETTIDAAFLADVENYQPEKEAESKTDETTSVIAPAGEPAIEEIMIDAEILSEPREEKPIMETAEKSKAESFFGKPSEYRLAMEKEEQPGSGRDSLRLEPLSLVPEPREIVSPKPELKPVETKVDGMSKAPQPSKAAKKETIDRLETWLRNIKKER